jgi:hypothetical protein
MRIVRFACHGHNEFATRAGPGEIEGFRQLVFAVWRAPVFQAKSREVILPECGIPRIDPMQAILESDSTVGQKHVIRPLGESLAPA